MDSPCPPSPDRQNSNTVLKLSILLFGSVFGQSIWGAFQDKIGRRKVLLICGNSLCIFLAIMVFAPNHYYFMVGSGLAGFFSSGLGAYTLPIELVSADKRFIVGTLITAGWATGAGWYLLSSFVKFQNSSIHGLIHITRDTF